MNGIIDLGAELLIDRTKVQQPQLQMLLAAIGRPLVSGSAWVVVAKKIAALYSLHLKSASVSSPRFAA